MIVNASGAVWAWLMVQIPMWIDKATSLLGVVSTAIGVVVLFYTARRAIIKYRLDALKLKEKNIEWEKKMKEVEKDLKDAEIKDPALIGVDSSVVTFMEGNTEVVSDAAIDTIIAFEGFSDKPYLDSAGVPTIGYGTTVYPSGDRVTMADREVNAELARHFVFYHASTDLEFLKAVVKPKLSQNQIDALVSFIYNIGQGAFATSTILKKINVNPDDPTIRDEFMRWVKAGGKELSGLKARRKKEADLYFSK